MFAAGMANAQTASYGLNGGSGLIDMPTAAVLPDGETAFTFTSTENSFNGTLTFQLLPNLETSVHFTTLNGWGGGTLYDKSIDLKYQILDENGMWPALAIGFRDFASNGAFSSEYLVATKSFGDSLSLSAGLGWGRLGSYNPLFSMGTRPAATSTSVDVDHMFSGDVALFGGIEWDTPIKGLSLKAEYSSDAYVQEVGFGLVERNSPFNFGLEYQPFGGVSFGAYYNHGSEFGLRLTLFANPNRPVVDPDLGSGPVPVNARPAGYNADTSWANSTAAQDAVVMALIPLLAAEGITLEEARLTGTSIDLYIRNNSKPQTTKAMGRIARMLTVALPPSIEIIRITPLGGPVAVTTVEIRRSDIEAQVERPNAGPDSFRSAVFTDAQNTLGDGAWTRDVFPNFSWSLNPRLPIELATGGEAGSFELQLGASASYQLGRGLSLNGSLSQLIYSSTDGVADSGPKLTRLTADYVTKLNPSTYARVSAGYLDGNYTGVDGEILWKPTNQNWGLGLELAVALERDGGTFAGLTDEQAYQAMGSFYWDTGYYGLEVQIDAGQYIGGDVGSTFKLSRRFENGWEVSGFVTVTDMPFSEFGEGNFAKGISVTIPLRWTLPSETRSNTTLSLGTSGEGGKLIGIGNRLYPMIRDYDVQDYYDSWGAFWQ